MLYAVILMLTIFAVINVLREFGVFEFSTQQGKLESKIREARKENKKRKNEKWILGIYSSVATLFSGILLTPNAYDNHKYYIERLELRAENLGRSLTPEELRGKYATPLLISLVFIPVSVFFPGAILFTVVAAVYFFTYQTIFKTQIRDEDEILDDYFIDLYLLLYSKLRQGSRARLQGTIEQYVSTLETSADTDVKRVMMKFSKYFLNLLALYEDHVAVPMLRDSYHSATVINFCNIAGQALNGVDNFDNLLTFRMQLVERKTNLMRKRQEQILRSGERSIFAIWIILFIFIAVGWYSKLPTGFF